MDIEQELRSALTDVPPAPAPRATWESFVRRARAVPSARRAPSRRRWVLRIGIAMAVLGAAVSAGFAVGVKQPRYFSAQPEYAPVPKAIPFVEPGTTEMRGAAFHAASGGPSSSEDLTSGGTAAASADLLARASASGEKIERSGTVTIEVGKHAFDPRWRAALAIISQNGGRVMSSQRGQSATTKGTQPTSGQILIRVPASSFDRMLDAVRTLGIVRGDSSESSDVTEQYVDLKSKVRSLRTEETALLRLFRSSRTVKDTLAIQSQLSVVQGQIDQTIGRIRFIDSRTAYSYITLNIGEPGALVTGAPRDSATFSKALDTAKTGLARIGTSVLIGGIWLAPFAVLGWLIFMAVRRRRARVWAGDETP